MPLEPTKHVNGRMWQPGQSGNPNGRPVGSRTAFSHGFLKDLAEVSQKGLAESRQLPSGRPFKFPDCPGFQGVRLPMLVTQFLTVLHCRQGSHFPFKTKRLSYTAPHQGRDLPTRSTLARAKAASRIAKIGTTTRAHSALAHPMRNTNTKQAYRPISIRPPSLRFLLFVITIALAN